MAQSSRPQTTGQAANMPPVVALRIAGDAAAEGIRVLDGSHIEIQRPRTTLKKTFDVGHIFPVAASTVECHETAIRGPLQSAIDAGRSCLIISVGSEKSGKSTSVRGRQEHDGLAALVARDLFAMIPVTASGIESMVTMQAALNAITPASGETALMGKQPVREVILDALAGDADQPAAGLNVRENADGLPHASTFFAEGLREVEVASASAAAQLLHQVIVRCEKEEAGLPLRIHLFVTFTVRQRTTDGRERSSQLSVVDVAGVPRPRSEGGPVAARGGAGRGRGGGGAAARGGGVSSAVGEDPFVKGLYRIIDTLQDGRPGAHIPYRDSKLTRMIARGLGGDALLLTLVHVRADRFEEAEAMIGLCGKLRRLPAASVGTAPPLSAQTASASSASSASHWWSPQASASSARASALATSSWTIPRPMTSLPCKRLCSAPSACWPACDNGTPSAAGQAQWPQRIHRLLSS